MPTKQSSGHAVVLGASVAGLLAARVLSESFEKVTIFDRDELPTGARDRKGVPQGAHTHGLLARGVQVLEELFPDVVVDLTALGGIAIDLQRDCVWVNDGRRIPRVESGLLGMCISRPALESYVRAQVTARPNVDIRPGFEALGLLTNADRSAVTGARVLARGGAGAEHVAADLVVDATGRGNRGPTWLAEIGYQKPFEEHVDAGTYYVTRQYRRKPGDGDFAAVVISPSPQLRRGGVAITAEGDRWMVTLIGVGAGEAPPADEQGYLDFAATLAGDDLHALLSRAEPIGEPRRMRLPTSVRRRYERMARLPEGFVALGDSVCSFNPAYGQGMTVAAVEALILRDCLTQGRRGLPRRFFAEAARVIDVPWDIAVGADLRYPEVEGMRDTKVKVLNGYVGMLHVAAERHPEVGRAFLTVANLMAPPTRLFAPSILAKVLWSGRASKAQPITAPSSDRTLEPVG